MNIGHDVIEENDASSFELNEDDKYADVCEPLYLRPKTVAIPSSLTFEERTRRKESPRRLERKQCASKSDSGRRRRDAKQRHGKKRTRFGRDHDGQILCKYFSNPETLWEDEIPLYWTNEESSNIQGRAQLDAQDAHSTMYHHHLLRLIDGCQHNDFKDTFHASDLVDSAFIVADSEFRGLEVALYSVKLLQENDNVVTSVLLQQEDEHVRIHKRVKKIASTSKSRTKHAKRLAYALAYGDALVAHSM